MNKALNFTTEDPNDWATPKPFFEMLADRFGTFDIDVCAWPHNAKCERYYTQDDDGLAQEWYGDAWCNPPYGHGHIIQWMQKAEKEIRHRPLRIVVFLVPAATDTTWFHEYCVAHGALILFVKNRIHFSSPERTGRGSHPSMVVRFTSASLDRGIPLEWGTIEATEEIRRGAIEGEKKQPKPKYKTGGLF